MDLKKLSDAELLRQSTTAERFGPYGQEIIMRFMDRLIRYTVGIYEMELGPDVKLSGSEKLRLAQELVPRVYLKMIEDDLAVLRAFRGTTDEDVYFFLGKVIIAVIFEYEGKQLMRPDGPMTLIEWIEMDAGDDDEDSIPEESSDPEDNSKATDLFSRTLEKIRGLIRRKLDR
jgi:hypothetical protein